MTCNSRAFIIGAERLKSFWGYISTEKHSAGATGGCVYVYDKAGRELARFKDMHYAYDLTFFPDGKRLAVRSNEGLIAVYDLEKLQLVKKFRYGKAKDPHDGNLCISKDGSLIYVIVYTCNEEKRGPETWLDVYETETFTRVKRLLKNEGFFLNYIERIVDEEQFYLLGSFKEDWCIAKLCGDKIEVCPISEKERDRAFWIKNWELSGFSEKSAEWTASSDKENLRRIENPLAELWERVSKR